MSEEYEEYDVEQEVDVATLESWKADKMIKRVKRNGETLARYKEIMDKHIQEIKGEFEAKKSTIDKENHFLLTTLKQYARTQKLVETDTQQKYESLSGNIVIKKAKVSPQKPEDQKIIGKIQNSYPELVENIKEKKLNWKDLKPKLVIQGNKVFDKDTGEELTKYIKITSSDEEVVVK